VLHGAYNFVGKFNSAKGCCDENKSRGRVEDTLTQRDPVVAGEDADLWFASSRDSVRHSPVSLGCDLCPDGNPRSSRNNVLSGRDDAPLVGDETPHDMAENYLTLTQAPGLNVKDEPADWYII
jgi:hypothetical protein